MRSLDSFRGHQRRARILPEQREPASLGVASGRRFVPPRELRATADRVRVTDDLLRLFSHEREHTQEARRFWAEQVGTKEAMMAVQELEDYDEVVRRFLELLPPEKRMEGLAPEDVMRAFAPEQRLAGLAPEQRLAGLAPEQRLAGLAPEQRILAMPDEVLRALSDDFIEKLPAPIRDALLERLGR